MKTITKTIEINLREQKDLENVLSSYLGKNVDISDVKCTLVHCVPCYGGNRMEHIWCLM